MVGKKVAWVDLVEDAAESAEASSEAGQAVEAVKEAALAEVEPEGSVRCLACRERVGSRRSASRALSGVFLIGSLTL